MGEDIEETQGHEVNYPMIGDPELELPSSTTCFPPTREHLRRPHRGEQRHRPYGFVVGPDKKIKLMLSYPMSTGRNFDEVLRVLDSMQLTAKYKVATPGELEAGRDVIIAGSVSDDEAKRSYPKGGGRRGRTSRIVPQPEIGSVGRNLKRLRHHDDGACFSNATVQAAVTRRTDALRAA